MRLPNNTEGNAERKDAKIKERRKNQPLKCDGLPRRLPRLWARPEVLWTPHGPLHLSADLLAVLAHACHEHEQLFQPGQADGNHPIEARLDRENNMRRSNLLPREKRRYDHGESRENLLHDAKQATSDPGQLRAISGTAEIIKEVKSNEIFAQVLIFPKEADWEQFSVMWKEALRIHSRAGKERTSYN